MSAVERLEERHGETPPTPGRGAGRGVSHRGRSDGAAGQGPGAAASAAGARALCRALPRPRLARLVALTVAAMTTLLVPVAVRRMIDFGFTPRGIALINSYFSVMIAVVAVLAVASASRFYLVMTIGERIVADLRRDVFAHLMSLSPAFFDSARSRRTDLAADRRHHPDQVGGRRLGFDRAAQSDAVHRRHRHDGDHEPAAFRLRAAGDPADRAAAGGVRALGAAAVAQRPGYAGGCDRLCFRTGRRDPDRAGLYRRAAGQRALRRRGRAGL